MIEGKTVQLIDDSDLDDLVTETYGRPYAFQQQEGCKPRGIFSITIPSDQEEYDEGNMHENIPDGVNGSKMGVKFKTWLDRDPNQLLKDSDNKISLDIFWTRNFYPSVHTIVNDLHKKGLIEAGDYIIDIDW